MARQLKLDLRESRVFIALEETVVAMTYVELNNRSTRERIRHPFPESVEQCAFCHGCGVERYHSILLRLCRHSILLRLCRRGEEQLVEGEIKFHDEGVLEWPNLGAAIRVDCTLHPDGAVAVAE